MVCENSNSPVNLNVRNNKCSIQCDLQFDYKISDCVATNSGSFLKFTYNAPSSVVVFNNILYTVQDIRIFSPSLHKFDNAKVDAELVITHSAAEAPKLVICVPLVKSSSVADTNSLINELINNSPGDKNASHPINVGNFTLNRIVPQGSYFTYFANVPYPKCNEDANIVVFDKTEAVKMSVAAYDFITRVTTDLGNSVKSTPRTNIFYNEGGVSTNESSNNGIYIDCQPLSDTNDNPVYVNNDRSTSDFTDSNGGFLGFKNFNEFKKSPYFIVSIVAICLLAVGIIGYIVKRYISSGGSLSDARDKLSRAFKRKGVDTA